MLKINIPLIRPSFVPLFFGAVEGTENAKTQI
jgi:hypothetical protein